MDMVSGFEPSKKETVTLKKLKMQRFGLANAKNLFHSINRENPDFNHLH